MQELSELGFEITKSLDSSKIIWNRIPQFRTFDTELVFVERLECLTTFFTNWWNNCLNSKTMPLVKLNIQVIGSLFIQYFPHVKYYVPLSATLEGHKGEFL